MNNSINSDIFKAYDIRGKYPTEIDEEIVLEIISALTTRLLKSKIYKPSAKFGGNELRPKIIIGHDARLSSPQLYNIIIKNLQSKIYNLKFIGIGLATTPMFYFLVNHFNADLGIMITASHNPKEYNGLKIVSKNAVPISGKDILRIMKHKL